MLRYKINGAILITFVAISLIFLLIQRPFQHQHLQTAMGKVKSILRTLVDRDRDHLANAIVDNRTREITLRVQQMLDIEGILAISLFDGKGHLLHSAGEHPKDTDLSAAEQKIIDGEVHIGEERGHGERRLTYFQEIQVIDERYGFIQVYYSLADIDREQRQSLLISGGLLTCIWVVMFVLLNVILAKTIIQPVRFLRDAMFRIQAGELGEQVPVKTKDEFGDLATTFNLMSQKLQQNQREHDRLNQLVKEQEEAQYRHELAEAANQAKSEFLRTISHEIRTPLNAIIGFSELARQTPYSESQQIYVERIAASAKILNALVNGVLDLAGIEAGKFTLIPDNFSVHTVLNTAVKPFQFGTAHDAVSWNVSIDPKIPAQLYGDSTRLTQVLVNLISNAVKFTKQGRISLIVEQEECQSDFVKSLHMAEESLLLHFSIKDTGVGIPEEEKSSIFQQFFQGKEATRRNVGGTGGIGMTIVKKIVDTMHGNIWFSSTPGVGTHVHVILPFSLKTEEKPERITAASLGALRILIAEDNSSNRLMLKDWLSHLGFLVETVENGKAACERWQHDPFDVILMDKQMPEMDGLQATRSIRHLEKHQGGHIHIIALTAAATTDDRAECLEAGMDDYLPKPVAIAALLHKLNALFPERSIVSEERTEASVPLKPVAENELLFAFENMPESWKHEPASKRSLLP